MKINYADRRNDKNIVSKKFKISDSTNKNFKGKVALIEIDRVEKKFIAKRLDGTNEIVIDNNYKIMTFFPEKGCYCMTVMYDNNSNLLQWYFDITKTNCEYDLEIPYGEDMYLDVVVLPNGDFYTLDEDDLKDALNEGIINKNEFDNAYVSMHNIEQMIKDDFEELKKFTEESFNLLIMKEE